MLSKNKAKFIRSLQLKKQREDQGCFVVEGKKSVLELLNSQFKIRIVVCTESFLENRDGALFAQQIGLRPYFPEVILCNPLELESISSLKTNQTVLAVAEIKTQTIPKKVKGLTLVLDHINDPGNLGTILRVADWFGIETVVASLGTTDFYNPKVLQASMGSFCRVQVYYTDLEKYLSTVKIPIYAASAKGESAHHFTFERDCCLILGNESHGISESLLPYVKRTVTIPPYGKAESLNVATAAAILCDNYRRLAEFGTVTYR